jgi:hypothetical protein
MKTATLFTGAAYKALFAQAYTAAADEPLLGGDKKLRKTLFLPLGVLTVSSIFWFLMNRPFQPRFLPVPFQPNPWVFVSLGANLLLGTLLALFPKTRSLAPVPFFFALFPAAFLITAFAGASFPSRIPPSAFAHGLDWKFYYDCLFFTVEIIFALFFLKLLRLGAPLSLRRPAPGLPMAAFVRFWELLFLAVTGGLLVQLLLQARFPPDRFVKLLRYQLPFALLLGLKEELLFRWILPRLGEGLLRHRFTAVCFCALLWGLYHGLFGEGTGTGFGPAFWVCVVSFWWSLVSYRYNSIWVALGGHIGVELYGFYLMYLPFLR